MDETLAITMLVVKVEETQSPESVFLTAAQGDLTRRWLTHQGLDPAVVV